MNLKCHTRQLAWFAVGATLVIAGFWKRITAGADIGLAFIGNVLFWLFVAGCAATAAAMVISFSRQLHRRQASRGACLNCRQKCNGEHDATAPVAVPTLRLRVERERDVPAVPELDAPNVYSLAAWQERKQAEAVGRESTPAETDRHADEPHQ